MTSIIKHLVVGVVASASLVLANGAPGFARDDHDTSGAAFLPPNPLVYLEVPQPERLFDRITSDRVQAFLGTIPGYADALDNPQLNELRQVATFVAGQLGTTWEEGLRTLIGGGVVLGIEEADPPRLVLVVTPSDAAFLEKAHSTLVSLAREDAKGKGAPDPIAEFDHRGMTGYSLSNEEAHAIVDGRLILSNSRSGLQAILDRHLDDQDRLTDSPAFADSRPEPDPLAWAFARVDRLRELDPDRFSGDEPDAGAMLLFGAWIDLIRQTPFASATLDWTDDLLALNLTLDTPEDGRSEAMARFLPPQGAGAPAPLKVDGLLATINLWRDQSALWEVREELLPPEALQNLAQLDSFAGTFFGGREFGDSVLEPLGHHWQLVAAVQDYEAMDPLPELKLPAFALVVELDPDRPEFAQRLRVAFQSFLGLVNLGASETGAPPLMLGSETYKNQSISLATFMPPPPAADDDQAEPAEVHYRHNFSPSIAELNGRFILSSSVGLTRSLIDAIQAEPDPETIDATLLMTADGPALADLVQVNRERLILQNMLERGNDRSTAERDVTVLAALLRYLGQGEMRLVDTPEHSSLSLQFQLGELDD
ncbi:hypothetical protein [Tautonia marina]|uniref:hypothetical protein n=1 Tax=Tautonia marina TaxID=2653855 RepID=UPI0012606B05|nr:hypothetical protein [Tautonia marina]